MTPKKKANELISLWQKYGPDSYPVCLDTVVNELVNKKSGHDRLKLADATLSNVDGAMLRSRQNPKQFVAFVNNSVKNKGRKRFTLAHEIGHFVLHRSLQSEFHCTRAMLNDFRVNQVEIEANQFASQILMPPNRVREYDNRQWNIATLKEIQERFEVSLQAAGLRMAMLSSRAIGFVVSVSDIVEWGCASEALFRKGCHFKPMMEVPLNSTAFGSDFSSERLDQQQVMNEGWRLSESFIEESTSGYDGRVYTCIDVR